MCPVCGTPIPDSKFFCNSCADKAPDSSIVTIGAALDRDDTTAADAAIASVVADLNS